MILSQKRYLQSVIDTIIKEKLAGSSLLSLERKYGMHHSTIIYHLKQQGYYNERSRLSKNFPPSIKFITDIVELNDTVTLTESLKNQKQISQNTKTYEDYVIEATKRGDFSKKDSKDIINTYRQNKNRSIITYSILS